VDSVLSEESVEVEDIYVDCGGLKGHCFYYCTVYPFFFLDELKAKENNSLLSLPLFSTCGKVLNSNNLLI
jgi:hypothetical protein